MSRVDNASENDIKIANPEQAPTDTVSCISWAPSGKISTFAASSWDSHVRIYNVNLESMALEQKSCFDTERPSLTVSWHEDEKTVFTGCADGSIKSFDVETRSSDTIGNHDGPVKDVHWLAEPNALLTVSFDKTLRFWDPRQGSKHVAGFKLKHQVFCSDLLYPLLGLGMSDSKVMFLNLPDIQRVLGTRLDAPMGFPIYLDSPLGVKTQVSSIGIFKGYADIPGIGKIDGAAIGGKDGRCNISNFHDKGTRTGTVTELHNVMTFRSHNQKIENQERPLQYPMNSLGFHPSKGKEFLYTAGGDGILHFWDSQKKNKIKQFQFEGVPITQTRMDPNGSFLAYSLGNDWARGIQSHMTQHSGIFVHVMDESELIFQKKEI